MSSTLCFLDNLIKVHCLSVTFEGYNDTLIEKLFKDLIEKQLVYSTLNFDLIRRSISEVIFVAYPSFRL